jgi:RNA recognition motif-containing protein
MPGFDSGFDSMPGFGAPPPSVTSLPPGGPYGSAPHHHGAPPVPHYASGGGAPYGSGPPPSGGSLGMGPMVGGSTRHQYQQRSYDLPPTGSAAPSHGGGGGGYGGTAPQYGSGGGGGGGYPGTHQSSGSYTPRGPPHGGAPGGGDSREATNTVWLGFLEPHHTDDFVRQEFSRYGKVLRVSRVAAKNMMFVHYEHVEEAKAAVDDALQRRFMGSCKVSYGRMFTYDAEELGRMERYEQARTNRSGGGGAFRGGIGYEGSDPSGAPGGGGGFASPRFPEAEPTNILWVGDVPPHLPDSEMHRSFSMFGRVVSINRVDSKGMAFVHFETVEEATKALRGMRGIPVGGHILKLNFGKPQQPRHDRFGGEGGGGGAPFERPDRDPPTNVVWLGLLAPTVSQADIDALLSPFEGFIDANHYPDKAIAFGHFDTVEQAVACRRALQGQSLHNQQLRVGHGKNMHTRSRAQDPYASMGVGGAPAYDQFGNPLLVPPPHLQGGGAGNGGDFGALVTTGGGMGGGQLSLLPSEGQSNNALSLVPSYVTRDRPIPKITAEHRVNALLSCSYFMCNVPAPHLLHPAVKEVCDAVDNVTDSASMMYLGSVIRKHSEPPALAPHTYAIVAKRLKEHFMGDPHKKLLVLYGAGIPVHDLPKPRAALDAFVLIAAAAAPGQDKDGAGYVSQVLKSVRRYCDPANDDDAALLQQIDGVEAKQKTESDLQNLLRMVQGGK